MRNDNRADLTIRSVARKKRKLPVFTEAQLLKGLTAKKIHADEVNDRIETGSLIINMKATL